MSDRLKQIRQKIDEENVNFIAMQFCTLGGEIKEVIQPARDLEEVFESGCGIDGSCAGFVPTNESDVVLRVDPDTFRIMPFGSPEDKTANLISDVYMVDGVTPFPGDPRGLLKRIVGEMRSEFGESWDFTLAPEMEYYLLEKDSQGRYVEHDTAYYCDVSPKDKGTAFRKKMSRTLDDLGIMCQKNHHEGVKTKHEINFRYGSAVRIADITMIYKQVVKYYAAEEGLTASFMPKPFYGHHGAGMHVHMSLRDTVEGRNLFYDPKAEYQLSEIGRAFMAGIMAHARGLAGVTNPSVNSYKRLVPGFEVPIYITWGLYNRSVLLRVPVSPPQARRVEIRCPDASSNPYLTFAALLAAGLDGLRRGLTLPAPVQENVYHMSPEELADRRIESLPGNLKEALECFAADEVLTRAFGPDLVRKFLDIKWKEWEEFSTLVHPWEMDKYVDV